MLDLESLLAPVSEDQPAGENLEYAEVDQLDRLATGTRGAFDPTSQEEVGAEEPDWRQVRDQAVNICTRTKDLRVCISTATNYAGPYQLANTNLWPAARLEDFFFFKQGDRWHLLCEDNAGSITGHERWVAHLVSQDGIRDWQPLYAGADYDHTIRWSEGTEFHPVRRERPWLLFENGRDTHLFTGVFDGQHTWNQPVPIR